MEHDRYIKAKTILLGEDGAGKTSLCLKRFENSGGGRSVIPKSSFLSQVSCSDRYPKARSDARVPYLR